MPSIKLPYPPSANKLYRAVKGRVIKSAVYRQWALSCQAFAMGADVLSEGSWRVSVDMVPPDRRRRDLDNILKPALDILVTLGLTPDDSECMEIIAHKREPFGAGHLLITYERAES